MVLRMVTSNKNPDFIDLVNYPLQYEGLMHLQKCIDPSWHFTQADMAKNFAICQRTILHSDPLDCKATLIFIFMDP